MENEVVKTLEPLKRPLAAEPLRPISYYAQFLKPHLPHDILKPYAPRLLLFSANIILGVGSLVIIKYLDPIWPLKLLLGIFTGCAFGSFGLFAHELFHGSVVRNRYLQFWLGFFALTPFLISPTFWRFWHNKLHHGNTQALVNDPDAFPTLRMFRHSRFMQVMFPFTPGSKHLRSYTYFFFWFSFHVLVAQFYLRGRNEVYKTLNNRRVTIELVGQFAICMGVFFWVGPSNFLWTFLIPLAIQNYFVMSYVATNHNLSPMTRVNDPLVNSLSVTNYPILEFVHFNFGYHIEHHIFPTMSPVHAKKVHTQLLKFFPLQMKVMPKRTAIRRLYQTARIYKNPHTLVNPETGTTYQTI